MGWSGCFLPAGGCPRSRKSRGCKDGGWVGSQETAIDTNQVSGPGVFQPGWELAIGYRFTNGTVLEFQWRHLVQAQYSYTAGLIPANGNVGANFENTFMTARVVNFSSETVPGFIYAHRPFEPDYLPIDEEHPVRPQDPYATAKWFGELLMEGLVGA